MFYTYLFIDPKTDLPVYVGKGRGMRWNDHFNPNSRSRIGNLIRKRTREGFVVLPIVNMEVDEETALQMEMFWINQFGRKNLGTGSLLNLTDGGEGTSGMTPWNKGVTPSEETKQKIREKRKLQVNVGCGMKGKVHTEEARKAISVANKGKPKPERSESHCQNLSDAQKRIGNKPPSRKGKTLTAEQKENLSKIRKELHSSDEYRKAQSERITKWWADRKLKEAKNG